MLELNEKEIACITLGTGSAAPTLRRRLASSVVLHRGAVYMFDAGEGTQIQYRKPRLRFNRLAVLMISHLHGDHVTGIIGMLMSMELQDRVEPLTIIGPPGIKRFIESNSRMLNTYFSFEINIIETSGGEITLDERHTITCLPLDHRTFCLGYRFVEHERPGKFHPERARALGIPEGPLWGKLQKGNPIQLENGRQVTPDMVMEPPLKGRIVTYCTDTRPCKNAVVLARQADILLHDGTFAAGEEEKARKRGHSTAAQAYDVAVQAQVNTLIITHISARYILTREMFPKGKPKKSPQIYIARDLDVWRIPWQGNPLRSKANKQNNRHAG